MEDGYMIVNKGNYFHKVIYRGSLKSYLLFGTIFK